MGHVVSRLGLAGLLLLLLMTASFLEPVFAGNIWHPSLTIVDHGGYLTIAGTAPAFPAGDSLGCSLESLDSSNTYVPAVCVDISTDLPPNTVFKKAVLLARKTGTTKWETCSEHELRTPAYERCRSRPPIIHLKDGTTAHLMCDPVRRSTCGPYKAVDFSLGAANFNCANFGPGMRRLDFRFTHTSRRGGYDFKIFAYYKNCGGSGPFESN